MYWLPAILILPYFFLLLKIYRNLLKIKPYHVSAQPSSFISVIIACRNEQEKLPSLLASLAGQDYSTELYEVLIVDDNSDDKTFQIASEQSALARLTVLKNKGKGKKEAIRTGIHASKGSLIITCDADCTMGKQWIKTIASFFEKNNPDMIICPVRLAASQRFSGWFQELEFLSLQGVTAGSAMAGNGIMCNGANLAFTRNAYLKHMDNLRSDLSTGDDVFLLHSLKKQTGSRIMWLESQDAVVTTSSSPTLKTFLSQRKRWISKWSSYTDRFTITTGILTFAAILLQIAALVSVLINISFLGLFITIFLLKSLPDFLILYNTSARYQKTSLMAWFLPAQLIYPFYVMSILIYSPADTPERGN
jgi:poly-beta-1,6-N-acetyl-D-glucosamine synthase